MGNVIASSIKTVITSLFRSTKAAKPVTEGIKQEVRQTFESPFSVGKDVEKPRVILSAVSKSPVSVPEARGPKPNASRPNDNEIEIRSPWN